MANNKLMGNYSHRGVLLMLVLKLPQCLNTGCLMIIQNDLALGVLNYGKYAHDDSHKFVLTLLKGDAYNFFRLD